MVIMKIRVSVSSLSKVQLRHPWQESVSLSVKTQTSCLHMFYVRISHRGPSRNSHFVLLLLYIGFCHSRGTGVAGLDNVLSRSSDLMVLLYRYISNTVRQINSFERRTQAVRNTTYSIK